MYRISAVSISSSHRLQRKAATKLILSFAVAQGHKSELSSFQSLKYPSLVELLLLNSSTVSGPCALHVMILKYTAST